MCVPARTSIPPTSGLPEDQRQQAQPQVPSRLNIGSQKGKTIGRVGRWLDIGLEKVLQKKEGSGLERTHPQTISKRKLRRYLLQIEQRKHHQPKKSRR